MWISITLGPIKCCCYMNNLDLNFLVRQLVSDGVMPVHSLHMHTLIGYLVRAVTMCMTLESDVLQVCGGNS